MPISTNTYVTGANKGNAESYSPVIDKITPIETPMLTIASRNSEKIGNVTHNWQSDSNGTPNPTALSEGADFVAAATTAPTQYQNSTMILEQNAKISRTQARIKNHGGSNTMDYQIAKKGLLHKQEIDVILSGKQAQGVGDPRVSRGYEHFVANSAGSRHGAGFTGPTNATTALTSETVFRDFSEELFLDCTSAMWTAGAAPDFALMGAYQKRKFNKFVGREANRATVDADTVFGTVDYYVSDAGKLMAIPSRNVSPNSVLLGAKSDVGIGWISKYEVEDRAPGAGDYAAKQIMSEFTLIVHAPEHGASITGLAGNAGQEPG
jgi:hypothetical protein